MRGIQQGRRELTAVWPPRAVLPKSIGLEV